MPEVPPSGARTDYRAHLDGMRTFAVASVLAFHAGISAFAGGFVGVDVFFVLSGYLVTGVLLSGIVDDGRIEFRRFYARRIRRLLPLALLVLVVTAVAFTALSSSLDVTEARGSFAAAFLYVANWWFVAESTEYIGSNIEASPILHFWSLSIEEQFYFVWPIVLYGAWRVARRASRRPFVVLAGAAGVAATASLVTALSIGARNLDRAYYGTDTRAYQLLLGAIISLLPAVAASGLTGRIVRWAAPIAAVVLLVLTTDLVSLSPIVRGAWAAGMTGLIIVGVEGSVVPQLSSMLSWRPLVMLGTRSYAIYLWHLPVLYVLSSEFDLDPWRSFAIAAIVSIALSEATGRLLEGPIRHSKPLDLVPRPVIATGLAMSLVAGLLVPSLLLDPSTTSTLIVDPAQSTTPDTFSSDAASVPTIAAQPGDSPRTTDAPIAVTFDWEAVRNDKDPAPECSAADPSVCTVVSGGDLHVLLIGDSHARVWQSAFVPAAEELGITLSIASVPRCSWHMGAVVAMATEFQEECLAAQEEVFDTVVPALQPDLVVLVHRAVFDPGQVFLADAAEFLAASDATVAHLLETADAVVIIEPTPLTSSDNDPLTCLAEGGPIDDCSFEASAAPTRLELRYRELAAASDSVTSVDLDRLACPRLPLCDAIVGSNVVWRDNSHMTATYTATLVDDIIDAGFLRS